MDICARLQIVKILDAIKVHLHALTSCSAVSYGGSCALGSRLDAICYLCPSRLDGIVGQKAISEALQASDFQWQHLPGVLRSR